MLIKKQLPPSPLYKPWEEFTKTGKLSTVSNPSVYASWQRCLELNMDPCDMNISRKLPAGDQNRLLEKNIMLLNASRPNLSILENSINQIPYAVLLCDPHGQILYQSGKGVVSDYFEQANLVVGGNCSESEIGTTAPGIVLVEKKPIVVLQEEHYNEIYHWCCCTAFPIFDIGKKLVGCLDVTTLYDQAHHMNFLNGLNIATVKSIQSSLHIQQLVEKMGDARDIIESTSNLSKNNMLVIDRSGRILLANQKAADLLKAPVYKLTGEHYREVLESDAIISCFSQQKRVQGLVKLKNRNSLNNKYNAQVRPLNNKEGGFIGTVVIIEEGKKQWSILRNSSHEVNYTFQTLIGKSPGMKRAITLATRFADTDMPILLQGDTGTGKEVFAHAIHNHSSRQGAFIPVNCAAIPHDLLESELFGYSKGAFTGALREGKKGKFEMAEGGTLFLDEINLMPIGAQGKLLRAVQDGEIVQLGDHTYKHFNVRIIAASSANLEGEFQKGHFRKDLFYRLSLVRIYLPTLKERLDDLEPLVYYFLEKSAGKNRRQALKIHPIVMQRLYSHNWPGNVRELENCIEFAIHLADSDEILLEHLPDYLGGGNPEGDVSLAPKYVQEMERSIILRALESANGHIGDAAKNLGISRSTIYRKRKQYGLIRSSKSHKK